MHEGEKEQVSLTIMQHKGRKEWSEGDIEAERGGVTYRKAIKGETGCVVVYLGYFPAGYCFFSGSQFYNKRAHIILCTCTAARRAKSLTFQSVQDIGFLSASWGHGVDFCPCSSLPAVGPLYFINVSTSPAAVPAAARKP